MKEISLTMGKVALIDDADFEQLNRHNWQACKGRNTWYAERFKMERGKPSHIKMHRVLLGLQKGDGKQVDHKNGNGLNNQRSNIRTCNRSQNQCNSYRPRGVSKYKGVSWDKSCHKWQVHININGRREFIGLYKNEKWAAHVYDRLAKRHYGDFARVNFPQENNPCEK